MADNNGTPLPAGAPYNRGEQLTMWLGGEAELPPGAPYNRDEQLTMWLKDHIGGGGGGGGSWSAEAVRLLNEILLSGVYTSDQTANIAALISAIGGGGNVDNITVADGIMTILSLENTPTLSDGVLSIV